MFRKELQPWLAERGYMGNYLARQYGENVRVRRNGGAEAGISRISPLGPEAFRGRSRHTSNG